MALVEAHSISKTFGGITALSDVDITVEENEIRGLIGPNGAGKTTLFNVLAGNYLPTSGQFLFAGADLTFKKVHARVRLGITRTFQNIRLFKSMSVIDNIKLGFHTLSNVGWLTAIFLPKKTAAEEKFVQEKAMLLLEKLHLSHVAFEQATSLSYGDQRRLEIARALAMKPRLLLLDEPAAGLNETEVGVLRDIISGIRDMGITIVLVEHDMRLLMSISDRITVLAHGRKIAEGAPAEVQADENVIAEYLGKKT